MFLDITVTDAQNFIQQLAVACFLAALFGALAGAWCIWMLGNLFEFLDWVIRQFKKYRRLRRLENEVVKSIFVERR